MDILVATTDRNLEYSLVQSMIFLPLNPIRTTKFFKLQELIHVAASYIFVH